MSDGPEDPEEQLWFEGRWEALLPVFRHKLAMARSEGNPREEADALGTLAFLLIETGDWAEAVPAARAEWRLQRRLKQPAEAATSLGVLAQVLAKVRRFGSALRCRRLALESFRRLGDAENVCQQEISLGSLLLDLGRCDEALAVLEAGRAGAREHGLVRELSRIQHLVARTRRALRDYPAAVLSQHESTTLRYEHGLSTGEGLGYLAELYVQAGRAWEAAECLQAAVEAYRQREGAEPEAIRIRCREIATGRQAARKRLTGPGLRLPAGRRPN